MRRNVGIAGCLVCAFSLLNACGAGIEDDLSGTSPTSSTLPKSGKATLRILLHDKPTAAADEVWVKFDKVTANHETQGWLTVSDKVKAVDLLKLQNGVVEEIGLAELPAGNYDQVRLHLVDAWVIVGGAKETLKVPSGEQSGLKIKTTLTMPECGTVTLTLDWDAGAHLVKNKGQGWILRPVIVVESVTKEDEICTITVPGRVVRGIAYDNGFLWITHSEPNSNGDYCRIAKIDAKTGQLLANSSSELLWNGRSITVGAGWVWVSDARADVVRKVDPNSLALVASFRTRGSEPAGIAFDGQHLWVSDPYRQYVQSYTTSGTQKSWFHIPNNSQWGLEYEAATKSLWLSDSYTPKSIHQRALSGQILATRTFNILPRAIYEIALGEGKLFVSDYTSDIKVLSWK